MDLGICFSFVEGSKDNALLYSNSMFVFCFFMVEFYVIIQSFFDSPQLTKHQSWSIPSLELMKLKEF